MNLAALIGVGAGAFASTNIDHLVMLVSFYADGRFQARQIIIGQFAGMAVLVSISVVGGLSAGLMPTHIVGWLGVLPIAIGIMRLFRQQNGTAEVIDGTSNTMTVSLTTVSNGGDNLALYIPLFAANSAIENGVIIITFLVMTLLWCVIAQIIVTNCFSLSTKQWGHRLLPFVLIAIGVYILIKTDALGL